LPPLLLTAFGIIPFSWRFAMLVAVAAGLGLVAMWRECRRATSACARMTCRLRWPPTRR
jgi:hypothetical protein